MIYSVFKIYRYVAMVAAAGLLLLASCKRDEPSGTIEKPVFGIKGTVNGAPVNIKAGVDSYYLYTTYDFDSNLYSFSGELKKTDCTVCPNSLKITIYDSTYNNGSAPVTLNLVLQKNDLEYANNIGTKSYQLTLKAEESGFLTPRYTWKMDTTVIGTNKIITGTFPDTSTRNICLIVEDSSGLCLDQRCNPVKPLQNVTDTCQPYFYYTIGSNDSTVQFFANPRNTYSWDFGDSQASSFQSPTHTYDSLRTYNVCLTTSLGGCTATLCKTVKLGVVAPCVSNFSYNNPQISTGAVIDLSKVEIHYVDANGEEYNSRLQPQPAGSSFTILSSAPYDKNEKGENTQSIKVSFKCRVFSTTTANFKDLVITDSDMAVAHP